jgi:hypothetical protein
MFKTKKARKPEITLMELPALERASRMLEIIQYPRDYIGQIKLIVETLRPTLFGRDVKIEYHEAGRPTAVFQQLTAGSAKVQFEFTMKPVAKGTVIAVHCIVGKWYVGRRELSPITLMRNKDTFHPSWVFGT